MQTENLISRDDYLTGNHTHREYYGQFVRRFQGIKTDVLHISNVENIKKAFEEDKHLNNIPLGKWDAFAVSIFIYYPGLSQLMREAGDLPTLAGGVSILKEAAIQLIEENS